MPELPEVERARAAIESAALHRRIADVDDTDTYECRPHAPGEIRAALLGRSLTVAHRRGKSMWCDLSAVGPDHPADTPADAPTAGSTNGSSVGSTAGSTGNPNGYRTDPSAPALGIHLGMAGRIVVTGAATIGTADAPAGNVTATTEGGDPRPSRALPGVTKWNRFTLFFADGGTLVLLDPRRLGRVRLDPGVHALGPDAATIDLRHFRAALAGGTAPVKARLLDQSALAGVGNLLADEALWQARIDPRRRVRDLDDADVARLHKCVRRSVARAIELGGVHLGRMIPSRHPGGRCPRCHAEMARGVVGSRTTWWCPVEQV